MQFSIKPLKLGSSLLPLAGLVALSPAQGQPIVPNTDGTGTIVVPNGDRFDIDGGQLSDDGANLFHSFDRFGLDSGQSANFLSTPDIQNILGRITGGDPSIIDGLIQVSGSDANLFLINPAGLVFGPNATLNVSGDFTATTATGIEFENGGWFDVIGANDWGSLVGDPSGFAFAATISNGSPFAPGAIVNEGNLEVATGRNLRLLGGTVVNTGNLQATGGTISVAAVPSNNLVRLSAEGSLLSLEVPSASQSTVLAFNPLQLPELLTGGVYESDASQVEIAADGTIRLSGSGIPIDPQTGDAIVSGTLDVATDDPGTSSLFFPSVQLFGDRVGVVGATLDASAIGRGGSIAIGGDLYGRGSLPRASRTLVDTNSILRADAIDFGDGGQINLWADEVTGFYGEISARGGANGGNGGFVEVSGRQTLFFEGTVDVGANLGDAGTLLLDPTNITIVDEISNPDPESSMPPEESQDPITPEDPENPTIPEEPEDSEMSDETVPDILEDDFSDEEITLDAQTLEEQEGNVVLEATNNITIAPGVSLAFAPKGGDISFVADSDRDGMGDFSMDETLSITARGRNFSISGANIIAGSIDTSGIDSSPGGDIILRATNGRIEIGPSDTRGFLDSSVRGRSFNSSILSDGGEIRLSATDGIGVGILSSNSHQEGSGRAGNGGSIELSTLEGNILTGAIQAYSLSENGKGSDGGSVSVSAPQGAISILGGIFESIDSRSAGGFNSDGDGGAIDLNSGSNLTLVGDLDSSASATAGESGNGGNTRLRAGGNIIGLGIDTSSSTQTGGEIAIDATGNIFLSTLRSEGGTQGGAIDILTRGSFETSNTFRAMNGEYVSISSAGESPGEIDIEVEETLQIAGAITDGTNTIAEVSTSIGQGGITVMVGGEPIPEPEPEPDPEIEPTPEPEPEPDPEIEPTPEPEPEPDPEIEPTPEPEPEPEPEPKPEPKPDPETDPETDPNPTRGVEEPEPEPEPEPEIEPTPEPEPELEPAPSPESEPSPQENELENDRAESSISTDLKAGTDTTASNLETDTSVTDASVTQTQSGIEIRTSQSDLSASETDSPTLGGNAGSSDTSPTAENRIDTAPTEPETIEATPTVEAQLEDSGNSSSDPVVATTEVETEVEDSGTSTPTEPVAAAPETEVEDSGNSSSDPVVATTEVETEVENSGNSSSDPVAAAPSGEAEEASETHKEPIADVAIAQTPELTVPTIPTSRVQVENQLDAGNLSGAIGGIEGMYAYRWGDRTGREMPNTFDSVFQLQDRLREIEAKTGQTSVLVYVLSRPEQLDLIAVTASGKPIYRSVPQAARENLIPVVRDFRISLTNPRQRDSQEYLAAAQKLYEWIVAPLEEDLETLGADTLVLSMDAGLRSMPIAALHDGEQFLIEKYSIGLIPSINLTDTSYQPLRNADVLAMGASEFDNGKPLPAVPVELSAIVRNSTLVPGQSINGLWEGKSFLNEAFTFDNLKAQRDAHPFGIVHLATHAKFQSGTPQDSYIQLWDGPLQLNQLRHLGWNEPPVELLVLSACQTAVGDPDTELGFAGLAVQAGVKSVLASLWYVSDEGTLGLMSEFYRQLQQDEVTIKSEALRQAQIAMLRGEIHLENGQLIWAEGSLPLPSELAQIDLETHDLSHPYYWSGFTMVGSPW